MPNYTAAANEPTDNSFNDYMGYAGLGSAGAGLGQLFFGGKNPADAASPYLNQIPGTITPYYQPYIDAGSNALSTLQGQYGQLTGNLPQLQNQYNTLMNNPAQTMNQIGAGYQQSPGYQYQVDQATKGANNAAAAGGMLGSPSEQQALAGNINNMANQDYYNYVDRAMQSYNQGLQGNQGLYNQGLQGYQGINQMGYNASNELAQSLANALMSQAQLQYAGQANQNQSQGGGWGDLIGGATTAAMSFL